MPHESKTDRVFTFVNYGFLVFCIVFVIYPLIFVISCSFSSPRAIMGGKVWLWPVKPGLLGYAAVFRSLKVWYGYKNSVIYASLGTLINIVLTVMIAYPLSRKDLAGRKQPRHNSRFPHQGFFRL